jgi:hypothetical protein
MKLKRHHKPRGPRVSGNTGAFSRNRRVSSGMERCTVRLQSTIYIKKEIIGESTNITSSK